MELDREKLEYLFHWVYYDIDQQVDESISKSQREAHMAIKCWNLILSFQAVFCFLGVDPGYESIDQYFRLNQAPNSRKKYKRFIKKIAIEKEQYEGPFFSKNTLGPKRKNLELDCIKFEYLMTNFISGIDGLNNLIRSVLQNSDEDPHYSAVTTANGLKCYFALFRHLNKTLPFSDQKGYFIYYNFTEDQFCQFEKSLQDEQQYHHDIQF